MYRYVVNTFKEEDLVDCYYSDGEGNSWTVRVSRDVEEASNIRDEMVDTDSGTFFFRLLNDAQHFASIFAQRAPGWTCSISEINQVYVSERPKVISKMVNEKGVLPV